MNYKMYFSIFFSLILLSVPISCKRGEKKENKRIYSIFSTSMLDLSWHSTTWYGPEAIQVDGEKVDSENRIILLTSWNLDSLYFYFKVEDTCLRVYQTVQDHPELYLDDMVEVLIDTRNDKDSCWSEDDIIYHINLFEVKKDDRGTSDCITDPTWNGNGRISVQLFGTLNDTTDVDMGYLVILALPWNELDRTPHSGLTMGLNFAYGDNDGKGRQLVDWVGASPMRSPYAFGNLILQKE